VKRFRVNAFLKEAKEKESLKKKEGKTA